MSDALDVVSLQGEEDCPADAGQSAFRSDLGFQATIDRLKEGIAAEDLWVIAEIDPQMLLRKGGFAIPATRQILYFHPRYMARLLSTNAAAIVEAPLKFVVMETSGGTIVRYPEAGPSLARYPGLAALAAELADVVRRIADGAKSAAPIAA